MKRAVVWVGLTISNVSFLLTTLFVLITYLATNKDTNAGASLAVGQNTTRGTLAFGVRHLSAQILGQSVVSADARAAIIESFFKKYHSPLAGHGQFIVAAADKYQLPFGLIPAIAQCESNLGKAVPPDSYNAWGYGVYGDLVLRFSSWEEAIERVAQGLREDYFDHGLDTPEKIMPKYTPPSRGSWAACVNQYLEELR